MCKNVLEDVLVDEVVRIEEHHIHLVVDECLTEPGSDEAPLARHVADTLPGVAWRLGEWDLEHVDVFTPNVA
jgi:hypothetical protein